jgi:hypothetical protein
LEIEKEKKAPQQNKTRKQKLREEKVNVEQVGEPISQLKDKEYNILVKISSKKNKSFKVDIVIYFRI